MTFTLPRLYPIIDTASLQARDVSPRQMAEALLKSGVRILQYRHKDVWTETVFQEAAEIARLAHEAGAAFVLNDRADYAVLLNAAVHVGQDDLPPEAVRRVIGKRVIGFSIHNRAQLVRGTTEDVDYLAVGPIYQTNSKKNPDPMLGTEGLRLLRALTRKPLVAIGGISLSNARQVIEAGADSVAIIGALLPPSCTPADLSRRAKEWLNLLS